MKRYGLETRDFLGGKTRLLLFSGDVMRWEDVLSWNRKKIFPLWEVDC